MNQRSQTSAPLFFTLLICSLGFLLRTPYLMEIIHGILGIAGIARLKLILLSDGLFFLVLEFAPHGPEHRKPLKNVLIGAASKFGLRFLVIALKILYLTF